MHSYRVTELTQLILWRMILLDTGCKHFALHAHIHLAALVSCPLSCLNTSTNSSEGIDPQDISDTNITTQNLTKEQSDCHLPLGHHKQALWAFLQPTVAERFCLESQWGFRAEQAIVDMIFLLRQLHEKCREQKGHPSIW